MTKGRGGGPGRFTGGEKTHRSEERSKKSPMKPLFTESVQRALEMLLPLGIFVIVLAAGYALRGYLLARLSRWARSNNFRMGDVVLSAIRTPFYRAVHHAGDLRGP